MYAKNQVVIEVNGGVAKVTRCPSDIEVIIIDYDNGDQLTNWLSALNWVKSKLGLRKEN